MYAERAARPVPGLEHRNVHTKKMPWTEMKSRHAGSSMNQQSECSHFIKVRPKGVMGNLQTTTVVVIGNQQTSYGSSAN